MKRGQSFWIDKIQYVYIQRIDSQTVYAGCLYDGKARRIHLPNDIKVKTKR